MKNLIIKYKEIITYVIFGVATTVVNLVCFKLFNVILTEKFYLISNVIAWLVSVIFAYITNKLWVFESKSWKLDVVSKEIVTFMGARVLSLGIEEAGLFLLVNILSFDKLSINIFNFTVGGKMISKIVLAVIVVLLNYIFSKFIIFKNKQGDKK